MTTISAIDEAKRLQPSYAPSASAAQTLRHKNIIMFVAPAATGKTHLIKEVAAMHTAFRCVPIFTTRPARADDEPDAFRVLPHDDAHVRIILDKIQAGELVQYVVHPSGRFYGTEPQDFPGKYNMLAMLSNAVDGISRLPFKRALVVGIVTEPDEWGKRLNARFPQGSEERPKRLQEAIESLEWLLSRPQDSFIWINNVPERSKHTATAFIDNVLYNKRTEDASHLARAMLKKAREMLQ